jgi:hypothetical protein
MCQDREGKARAARGGVTPKARAARGGVTPKARAARGGVTPKARAARGGVTPGPGGGSRPYGETPRTAANPAITPDPRGRVRD